MDRVTRFSVTCPECGQDDNVRHSQMKWYESPAQWLGRIMYRCYDCGHRFLGDAKAPAMPPRLESASGTAPDSRPVCPNCAHAVELLLTAEEFREARLLGWYISCPKCSAAFVYHA